MLRMDTKQELQRILDELRKPFHPSHVSWKPGAVKGERALALAYADLRAYMNRLDEVCGTDWSVTYDPWGEDRIICRLTIMDLQRSSIGESDKESERSEIGGTVAEAQAFKRAAAMFGLGRYLYNLPTGWADYDPATKKFTDKAKAKLTGILVQHYRRANDGKSELADIVNENVSEEPQPERASKEQLKQLGDAGQQFYGAEWAEQLLKLVQAVSSGATSNVSELLPSEATKLIDGIRRKMAQANGTPK